MRLAKRGPFANSITPLLQYSITPFLLLLFAASASADTVRMKDGRTWEGAAERLEDGRVELTLSAGIVVFFGADQVAEIIKARPKADVLADMRGKIADTAEAHFLLAQWCYQNGLPKERERELRRVLQLDPEHAAAREQLGYVKTEQGWIDRTEVLRAKGYVKYGGKWVLPEEAEQRRDAAFQADLWQLLRRAASRHGETQRQALQKLAGLRDPRAVPVLTRALQSKNDTVRVLAARVLRQTGSPEAVPGLARQAILADSAVVRVETLKAAAALDRNATVRFVAAQLQGRSLATRRRAASALGILGDPAAVPGLVATLTVRVAPSAGAFYPTTRIPDYETTDVVVTSGNTHYIIEVPLIRMNTGVYLGARDSDGVPAGARYIPVKEAREALRLITGEDFGYDKKKWLNWWGRRQLREKPDRGAGAKPADGPGEKKP